MNDNELFELCKEVYKRHKWSPTIGCWLNELGMSLTRNDWQGDEESLVKMGYYPLYTSDYLLEKLPDQLHKDGLIYYLTLSTKFGDEFKANYVTPTGYLYLFLEPESSTPCGTLLQLVIALDDAGVKL